MGPIRLRTVHTKTRDGCPLDTPLDQCFHSVADETMPETVENKEIDGVKFTTCEENKISHIISGEQGPFPCFGYVLDVEKNLKPNQF